MIDALDLILKKMFADALVEELAESGTRSLDPRSDIDITFGPPDGTQRPAEATSILNIDLVDVRENRRLRRNDRVALGPRPGAVETQAPLRLDCHYLASAWGAGDAVDEADVFHTHRLLYAASAALLRHNPLVPRDVFGVPETLDSEVDDFVAADPLRQLPAFVSADPVLKDFYTLDPILRDLEIPIDPLPPEGYPKVAEFWGLMGQGARWRPVAYFVATIPVERTRVARGPEVRSIGTTYFPPSGHGDPAPRVETFFTVGGVVRRALPGSGELVPARFATIELSYEREEPPPPGRPEMRRVRKRLESATTDAEGRYVFERVEGGPITLGLPGAGVSRSVPPLAIDDYDFQF